ncbi:MAG: ABC transporter substrate-binding protein [Clostridia bacterium]|nr:ABC transporter substrate-binding protein [Clostridia bacterium]
MKKLLAVLLAAMMLFSLAACGGNNATNGNTDDTTGATDDVVYNVGICQWVQHDALDQATLGFKDALVDILGEDKVKFDEQNASNDSTSCSTIINNFVSNKVDLIMANATPVLQTAAAATTEIPILGTSVTEYGVALEIDDFTGTVGGNISGTSDLAPLDQQAQMIIDLVPDAKNVGIIYCSAEANSVYQVKVVKGYLEGKGIKVTEYPFSDSNDISAVTNAACETSDAIYIPTDNAAASSTGVIDGICRPAKIPVIAGEAGICGGCGIATLSISYYKLGYKTGEMAAKVLTGEADISEMAIEYDEDVVKKYNAEICKELGMTMPEDYVALDAE